MSMPKDIDWIALNRLRQMYLKESSKLQDNYWNSTDTLRSYDATFAQRIGWKWDAVIEEFKSRYSANFPQKMQLLDWGCGTGIAARRFVTAFRDADFAHVYFYDRSIEAAQFAQKKFREIYPNLSNSFMHEAPKSRFILLVSHVLSELDSKSILALEGLARLSDAVFFVEPGTPASSDKLIRIRESLRSEIAFVAPCPHSDECGLLHKKDELDWCHNFARPPSEIFHDPDWSLFAKRMEIDLRSLPVSFLIGMKPKIAPPIGSNNCVRLLGRPKVGKVGATFVGCEKVGVHKMLVEKRRHASTVKQLSQAPFTALISRDQLKLTS